MKNNVKKIPEHRIIMEFNKENKNGRIYQENVVKIVNL